MARKGKIEIGASVTVGAKEDGSLSAIEKRIEKLSNEEIEINIKDATKHLKELEKMEKALGKNMAGAIEAQRKQFNDLIEKCKEEQKLRAESLKQVEREVKAAKELQKVEGERAKPQEKKTSEPTKREQELADITKGLKGIRGVANAFENPSIQKTEEQVQKLIDKLDEYQTKLEAMKRLRKGNERAMYDTAKSEINDLRRALSAIQAVKDRTPSMKPKLEKKEKEVEQEKPKQTATPTPAPAKDPTVEGIQKQAAAAKEQARSLAQVNAELEKEKEKLAEIERAQTRNDAAREALQRKREDYSGEVLQSDKAVYDTNKIAVATNALRAFNTELAKRNQFLDKYRQLYRIIQGSFIGQYSISNGIYTDMDQFISGNSMMKELDNLAKNGINGVTNARIYELFSGVVRGLQRDIFDVNGLISSGEVLGAKVNSDLDQEETRLGQEQQRLYDEREAQLARINALQREQLDLMVQKGREEKKNTQTQNIGMASDPEELETLRKENGALEEKLELLKEIAELYGSSITQAKRDRYEALNQKEAESGLTRAEEDRYYELGDAINEADEALEQFGATYEQIILKLENGRKISILPNDEGLRKLSKFYDEGYGASFNGVDVVDITFERVKAIEESSNTIEEETKAIEDNTRATEENVQAKKRLAAQSIEKSEFLQSIEIFQEKFEEECSYLNTIAEKRKELQKILKDEYSVYKDMKFQYENPDKMPTSGVIYEGSFEDLLYQEKRLEAIFGLYEKYGGKVNNLGKRLGGFIDEQGWVGGYQAELDDYNAKLQKAEETAKRLESQQQFFATPSGQIGMFEGMADPIFETVDASDELGDAMQKVAQISDQISFDDVLKSANKEIPKTIKSYKDLQIVLEECERLANGMIEQKKPEIIDIVESGRYKPIESYSAYGTSREIELITDAWKAYQQLEGTVESTNEDLIRAKNTVIALAVSYARSHKTLSALNDKQLESFTRGKETEYNNAKDTYQIQWGIHGTNTEHNNKLFDQMKAIRGRLIGNDTKDLPEDIRNQLLDYINQIILKGGKATDVLAPMAKLMGLDDIGQFKKSVGQEIADLIDMDPVKIKFLDLCDAIENAGMTADDAIRQFNEFKDSITDTGRQVETVEEKRKYYEIDEKAARLSKQMRSFDDYKEGSATASYKAAVDEMTKIVEEKKAQFPDKSEQLDKWLDQYAKNLATYINRDNQIGAQYPSVMISGAGNYNIKKHNKQMASWGKNYQYYDDKVLSIASKIKNLGSAGMDVIRGDESDALEKLEAKLEYMKYWHDVMVEVNKYYRKNKTLDGFEGVEPDELERIKQDLATMKQLGMHDVPYPQYTLSNDNQNIKRIEGRIAELKRLKGNEGLEEENNIYKLWTDKQDMRIRISFEIGKPEQEIIDLLRGNSFKWSPKNQAWQRQLTDNAVYTTKNIQKKLREHYQITGNAQPIMPQEPVPVPVQPIVAPELVESAIEESAGSQPVEVPVKPVVDSSQLVYHAGDLSNIANTLKSFTLGHIKPTPNEGIFNGLTGLYTTDDLKEFVGNEWDSAPISILDKSFYKMFKPGSNDLAKKTMDFFTDLVANMYGYIEGYDFEKDQVFKKQYSRPSMDLYKEAQDIFGKEVFEKAGLTFEKFDKWIDESRASVKGLEFVSKALPVIDEGVSKIGYGTVLKGAPESLINADSFQTQLMKMLGFEGLDLSGTRYNGTYSGGTVIFDIKPESIKAVNESWTKLMADNGVLKFTEDELQQSLEYEKKRRQLAFETAKAYSKTAIPVQPSVEPNAVEAAIQNSTNGAPVEMPVTPVIEPKETQRVIEENTNGNPVEVPVTPVVEQTEDIVKSRISNLVAQANQIPQAENTTRFVHFTDTNNNQSIFENGLRMVNQRLNTTVLSLQEYQDALNGVGETYASVMGIAQQHGSSDNAVLLDIPNDSIIAYTATTGDLETVSRSFIRATIDTKNGLYELNTAYDASHDVVSEYTEAIREAKAEEEGVTSRRPGLKRSASLEAVQSQILENRKSFVTGQTGNMETLQVVETTTTATDQLTQGIQQVGSAAEQEVAPIETITEKMEALRTQFVELTNDFVNNKKYGAITIGREKNYYLDRAEMLHKALGIFDKYIELSGITEIENNSDMDPSNFNPFFRLPAGTTSIDEARQKLADEYKKSVKMASRADDAIRLVDELKSTFGIDAKGNKEYFKTRSDFQSGKIDYDTAWASISEIARRSLEQVGNTAQQTAQQLEQQASANETLAASSEQAVQQVEQQATETSANTEPTQLELFDRDFSTFAEFANGLDSSGQLYSIVQQRIQATRNQVDQGLLDACDAYAAIFEEIGQTYAEMTPPTQEIRKMSIQEYTKFMKGIDLNKLFADWGIDKENQGAIRDAFARLGDVIVSKGNASRSDADIQGQIDNISKLILQYAQEPKGIAENSLGWVLDELSGKIFYDERDVKSIGKEHFDALRSQIKGKLSLTKTNDAMNLPIDVFFESLSEQLQSLIISTWETKNGLEFNYSKASILEGVASVYQSAQRNVQQAGKPVFDELTSSEAIESVRNSTNALIDTAIGNAEQLLRTEQQITGAIEEQNQARSEGNALAKNTQSGTGDDVPERQDIVERIMKDALEQLRNANNNNKAQISFDGVFTPDALLKRFQEFAQNIDGLELDVGKIRVHGDTAQVQLYNDALKVTVDQTWRLKEATEGAESALEFVDQSFSQNVKALNENTFDVSGVRDKANSEIAKLQADADRAKYSLEELKRLASNIASEDDYKKFNTQLQAARNNIQAIKNSTITKGSMNPLANMQRDMQNANIELDTMELKLQKIGDVQGVEDARDTIRDMRAAVEEFNAAADTDSQQQAYNRYSDLRSTFQKQLEYLNAAKSVPQENSLETYYKSLFDTVQRINNLESQINTLKIKDGGKGIYSELIASLENEKSTLLGKIDQIGAEINQYFNGVFTSVGDTDKVKLPFNSLLKDTGSYNTILDFLNSVEARATLGADAVNKLVQAFYNSSQAGSEFAEKINAQIKPAEEAFARLQQIIRSGGLNVDNDKTYQEMQQKFEMLKQFSQTDMSKWPAEGIAYFINLAKSVAEYANNLSKAAEQEAKYFAGKTKAYAGDTMYGNPQKNELMVIPQSEENIDTARQKLEKYVATFTEGTGIITGFTTAANGISQITFSALDKGTGQFRTFTAEMGRCTDNIYRTEITLNGLASGTNAAKKSIASLATVMSQLNGISGAEEQLKALWEVYQNLQNAINNKGNSQNVGDQNMLKNMATDADKARKEVEKLIKEWAKAQAGLDDGNLTSLGSIDKNGNIKEQMWEKIKAGADGARASFVSFDEKTNTLTYTLTNADKTVTTMTAHMYGLNGAVTTQTGKTEKLKTGWQEFTGALKGAAKGIGQYLGRAFSMWAIIGQIKQGFNAVKQIDAALTELKKVTDETEASYQKFLETASQTAGKIGSTVSDFTLASANFARLGYTMEESAKMAETAIVYKNVADGLDSVEESTESIISTMRAFGIESDNTMSIIDKFNEVGKLIAQIMQ